MNPLPPGVYDNRKGRLAAMLHYLGYAETCDLAAEFFAAYQNGLEDELPRYALMEADERGNSGGPWWRVGDDPRALHDESVNQECPEDWPVVGIVDLDTGEQVEA